MAVTYGILMFDDFEELDALGPWEVFGMAVEGKPGDRLVSVSRDGAQVRARKGLRIVPDHALTDCPPLDVLLVPGGDGTNPLVADREILDWIAARAAKAQWATSVCTGARLMIKSGVARGKRVTTHWSAIDSLREWNEAEVLSGPRYVRDGKVVTAAGVSAGIDMALWIVGQLYDAAYARQVQHWMEYDPAPPYTAEV
jgi:transcriptional regulator GlxA family with amidase domain